MRLTDQGFVVSVSYIPLRNTRRLLT